MAYDEHGNYYFNPQIDSEDAQLLETADKMAHVQNFKAAQANQQAQTKFAMDSWNQALKEAGLDQDSYNQICAEDPKFAGEIIKQSLRVTAKAVAAKKGRTAAPSAQAQTRPEPVQNREAIAKYKEKVDKTGSITEEEQLDALERIAGRLV